MWVEASHHVWLHINISMEEEGVGEWLHLSIISLWLLLPHLSHYREYLTFKCWVYGKKTLSTGITVQIDNIYLSINTENVLVW